ncbi:MAG: UDP-N-acetylmuramoyl-L-alanyl-D-glutamate--2,6-diaminopimelate ligase [Burkholderiales bacterium]|nr:UDP-N-acetylmuramoyl-L-alanyl-D-glutamate--2,6-diaminopimelate ligase [Burkholderiales bacterium]
MPVRKGLGEPLSGQAQDILRRLRAEGVAAASLAADSRALSPGDVFLACPGARADARSHIPEAIERGAAAVLWERSGFEWNPEWRLPNVAVEGLRALAGFIAHEVYGRPSERLWTIGVTGTNGKTSCSHWIAQGCGLAGARTAVIGTLGTGFPALPGGVAAAMRESERTTPDAVELHRSLAGLLREGAQGVAMEVSSIGLDQGRANGIAFGAALFTNLSRDHLDYHGTMEAYARAKQRLFESPGLAHAVLNMDDVLGVQIARLLAGSGVHRIGYSLQEGAAARSGVDSYLEAHSLAVSARGIEFRARTSWGEAPVQSALIGRYNVANLLGVLGTMLASGVPFGEAAAAIERLEPVAGRMQRLGGGGRPLVVVDYAHSPDALEQALVALGDVARACGGRLVALFGCGGERDRGKREMMGAVASRHADAIVITSDNPRGEPPEDIIAEVARGVRIPYESVLERGEAIRRALRSAGPRDVVLLAGKGHENYQEIAGRRLPFSDLEAARLALEDWRE